ncbi:MAG: SusE domain-containing protein [Alistipes sp.]|nr:SusE domain-containing protein [Alistipes sp.]
MKFLKYISMFAAAALLFSCYEDDKTMAMPADEVVAPVMNEMTNIVVDEENLQSEVTFSWSGVDYGYAAEVTYSLFANYQDVDYQIGQSYTTSYTITKENLNNALVNTKGLAVPEFATSTVFFYVVANISSDDTYAKRSNAIQLDITTVKSTAAPWVRRPLFIAGNFQGWAPDARGPVLWENGENSDVYEGLVYLGAGNNTANKQDDGLCHFKFCIENSWAGNLGGSADAFTNEGDPAHLLAEEGLYWIKVTLLNNRTTGFMQLTPVSSISVIGSVVGNWDTDVELTPAGIPEVGDEDYDNKYYAAMRAQTFSGVCDNAVAGEYKYRLNHDWATNWGGDLAHLVQGGDNIPSPYSGKVRFSINFRGDIDALAEDMTNPSPISGTVEQAE